MIHNIGLHMVMIYHVQADVVFRSTRAEAPDYDLFRQF